MQWVCNVLYCCLNPVKVTAFSLLLSKDWFATLSAQKLKNAKRSDLISVFAYHPAPDPTLRGVEILLIASSYWNRRQTLAWWATWLVRRFYLFYRCLFCSRFFFSFFSIQDPILRSKETPRFHGYGNNRILMDTAELRAPIRKRHHIAQIVFLSGILLVRTKGIIVDFSNPPDKYNRDWLGSSNTNQSPIQSGNQCRTNNNSVEVLMMIHLMMNKVTYLLYSHLVMQHLALKHTKHHNSLPFNLTLNTHFWANQLELFTCVTRNTR